MFSRLKNSFSPTKRPIKADNDDTRKRNRLSKPPKSTSSLNLSELSLLQPGRRNSTLFPLSRSTEDLQDQSQFNPNDEAGDLGKAAPLAPESEGSKVPPQIDLSSLRGQASVASDVETQSPPLSDLRPTVASTVSTIYNTCRFSLTSSKEYKEGKVATRPRTDNRSRDSFGEDLPAPIPTRRKSFRQPGIATRPLKEGNWGSLPPGKTGRDAERDFCIDSSIPQETFLQELDPEINRAYKPVPPPLVRTETPADLVFLGGLKMGSLHVTNGRASPTPSDLSRRVQTRSTPNLRTAPSNDGSHHKGGDADAQAISHNATSKPLAMPELSPRSSAKVPRYRSHLRFSSDDSVPKVVMTYGDAYQSSQMRKPINIIAMKARSPDGSGSIAEKYRAELPSTPFTSSKHIATTHSILEPPSKSFECDDNPFEDGSLTPSESDSVGNSTVDTLYSSHGVVVAREKQGLLPQNARSAHTVADSGYSSNSSLQAVQKEIQNGPAAEGSELGHPHVAATKAAQNELGIEKRRQESRPHPRPLRPSILKQAGTTTKSLPIFENLNRSSTTISTVQTTASTPPAQKWKKLTKIHLKSRSARSKDISLQRCHEIFNGSIPPVPAEFTANLAIRSERVPELQRTCETRQHIAESPPIAHIEPVEIRFPSPTPSLNGPDDESAPFRHPNRRKSTFRIGSKSDRRSSLHRSSNDLSESDALAVIQDFGTASQSLGGNPYDVARTALCSGPPRNAVPGYKTNPHSITSAIKRPKSTGGMDAQTAAQLARVRSRSIRERDATSVAEKRSLFNDRGGVPGKNLRPVSLAINTPPLPPLPAGFHSSQRQSWAPQATNAPVQQLDSWGAGRDMTLYKKNRLIGPVNEQASLSPPKGSTSHHGWGNEGSLEVYPADHHQPIQERRQSWRSDGVQINFHQSLDPSRAHEKSDLKDRPMNEAHYEDCNSCPRSQAASHGRLEWIRRGQEEDAARPPPAPHTLIASSVVEGGNWLAHAEVWQVRRQLAVDAFRRSNDPGSDKDQRLCPEIRSPNASSVEAHNHHIASSKTDHQYPGKVEFHSEASDGGRHRQSNSQALSRPENEVNSYHESNTRSRTQGLETRPDRVGVRTKPQSNRYYSARFSHGYEHGSVFDSSVGTGFGQRLLKEQGEKARNEAVESSSEVPTIAGLQTF